MTTSERGLPSIPPGKTSRRLARSEAGMPRRFRGTLGCNAMGKWGMSETLERTFEGLARLRSSAKKFARDEVQQIAAAVIDYLRSQPAYGTFSEIAARHLWDEYCWSMQAGPFDIDMGWNEVRPGSVSDGFDDLVRAVIRSEVEKRPDYVLVFLTALAVEEGDEGSEEAGALGIINVDGIVSRVLEDVNSRVSLRKLDLIGPDRSDEIRMEITGSGMVWSILDERNEASDILAGHSDALLDPDEDLSPLAEELVEAFMEAVGEEEPGEILSEILERFGDDLRRMIRENDVLPSLEEMRADLLQQLDA